MVVRGFLVIVGVCMTLGCSMFAPSDRELMGDNVDAAVDDADGSRDSSLQESSSQESSACREQGSSCSDDNECCSGSCRSEHCR
jgi:hypothetical protein